MPIIKKKMYYSFIALISGILASIIFFRSIIIGGGSIFALMFILVTLFAAYKSFKVEEPHNKINKITVSIGIVPIILVIVFWLFLVFIYWYFSGMS